MAIILAHGISGVLRVLHALKTFDALIAAMDEVERMMQQNEVVETARPLVPSPDILCARCAHRYDEHCWSVLHTHTDTSETHHTSEPKECVICGDIDGGCKAFI